jgi:uncharacterized SAM-binding protein YcdF (DUF218 family)
VPPTTPPAVGRFRRTLWIAVVIALALGVAGFVCLGTFLVREDVLQPSDAIFVLGGSDMNRPLEAGDLYLAGYGKRIVLSSENRDEAATRLRARGIHYPLDSELAREALNAYGVPANAIESPPRTHDNTAAEAVTLRELARAHAWTHVIVVTEKYHTRRAGFAMRRALRGAGITVIMRASRYDPSEPERWWRHRSDIRSVMLETPKLAAYLLGLGE